MKSLVRVVHQMALHGSDMGLQEIGKVSGLAATGGIVQIGDGNGRQHQAVMIGFERATLELKGRKAAQVEMKHLLKTQHYHTT